MNKITTFIIIALLVAVTAGISLAAATDRFHGGSYDGYRLGTISNTTIDDGLPSSTSIMVQ